MKKNTFLLLCCIAAIASISLMAYRTHNRVYDMAAWHLTTISLEHFQFRGAVGLQKSNATSILETQKALQNIDPLFTQKPHEALARYQQLMEKDPGHLGLRLRLGILQLKLHQMEAAKEHLYFVHAHPEAGLQPDAAWFLALSAIIEKDNGKAKQFLQESIDLECSYLADAKKLMELF